MRPPSFIDAGSVYVLKIIFLRKCFFGILFVHGSDGSAKKPRIKKQETTQNDLLVLILDARPNVEARHDHEDDKVTKRASPKKTLPRPRLFCLPFIVTQEVSHAQT